MLLKCYQNSVSPIHPQNDNFHHPDHCIQHSPPVSRASFRGFYRKQLSLTHIFKQFSDKFNLQMFKNKCFNKCGYVITIKLIFYFMKFRQFT